MKKITTLACLATLALMIQSCNQQANENENAPTEVTDDVAKEANKDVMEGQDQRDAKHFVELYGGSMCEIRLSEQARAKAMHAQTKDFAKMMVEDHTAMNKDLEALAGKLQITLQTDISDDAKEDIADMGKKVGHDYDMAYLDKAISKHKEAIDHAEDLSKNSENEEVRTFFTKALPKLQHHLTMAEYAKEAIDKK